MATHFIVIDLWRCLGSGSCIASCRALGNDPPKIGLKKVGPIKVGEKPRIEFLHYPQGACNECAYCMEMFQKKGITACVSNCPDKAMSIVESEDLGRLLRDKNSGQGFYIQVFK